VITEDIFTIRSPMGKDLKGGDLRHTGYIPEFAQELIQKGFLSVEVFT
jgi:hypothetical protein